MTDTAPEAPDDHGAWRRMKIPAGQTAEEVMAELGITPPDEPAPQE